MASWCPGWKIEKHLPEGGQAFTYVARRTSSPDDDRLYVLKKLKNRERLSRFEKESEVLKKLSHPGILRVVEMSGSQDTPYYVAEYCERGDLSKFDFSGRSLLDRLLLFRQVCDAMSASHQAGILHRDLKPQNILVRADGSIAVGDFGLCFDLNDIEERLTSSSEAVGARHYIAPELEDGRVQDPRPASDVYSLGKLLYYFLCQRSFARERHREGTYNLLGPDGETGLFFVYDLLDKSINTNSNQRFQNAAEFLYGLDVVIFKISKEAHVLNLAAPQRCIYCIVGKYTVQDRGPERLTLQCPSCGNIQHFMGRREWWKV
jgi:serine/threonine protein kinase